LTTAIQLQPGVVYVASVGINSRYAVAVSGFAAPIESGVLHSAPGANGVYASVLGTLPDQSWQASNYFVDVVVQTSAAPFAISQVSPSAGAEKFVGAVTAAFSRPADPTSIVGDAVTVTNANGTSMPGTVSYDAPTATVTWTPVQPLESGVYTAKVSPAIRGEGGGSQPGTTWSFSAIKCPCSLFTNAQSPALQPRGTYELGVRVVSDSAGTINALRYFKAATETGSHVGSIWTADGTRIAQVTFSNETASGWQTQQLVTPVRLQPGTVYTLSVNANTAFAQSINGLASSVSSGLFRTADGANGVFSTSVGAFPNESYQSSNYFVDDVAGG
jgi:hypothetical protein